MGSENGLELVRRKCPDEIVLIGVEEVASVLALKQTFPVTKSGVGWS